MKNDEKFLEVSVVDTGIGIKEEDQDKLFKLFGYVQDSKQMNIHGIGLGLTISKRIIEQFDGEVSMHSIEGEGSTFAFTLKLFDKSDQENNKQIKSSRMIKKLETDQIIQNEKNYSTNVTSFVFEWKPK